jgi:hypothetical protein
MFRKNRYPRISQVVDRLALEFLENRRLLAGDFRAGDANRDYYFDEADMIQVAKSGKYDTGEAAIWTEGDWNEDGQFNVQDLLAAIRTSTYRNGPLSRSR